MNIQEYISSGIIESYVLGITSEPENQEIENLSKQYPEINAAILAIQEALNAYALKHSIDPPVDLKHKIISTIETVEEINHRKEDANIITLKPKRSTFDYKTLLIAASFLLVALSGFYIARLVNQLSSLKTELASLAQYNDSLILDMAVQKENEHLADAQLALLKSPMTKMIELKGMPESPQAKAMVVWNVASREVYVEIENLPVPPANMQYQLWALHEGKPVDAGVIENPLAKGGIHQMKDIEKAEAFAITLEKKGGNPAPQGEMYAMGSI